MTGQGELIADMSLLTMAQDIVQSAGLVVQLAMQIGRRSRLQCEALVEVFACMGSRASRGAQHLKLLFRQPAD
jgi:hypothetical protein